MTLDSAPVVAGWRLLAHPIFLEQFESLVRQVDALKTKDAVGYAKKAATKRLAVLVSLMLDKVPLDPAAPEYRQGKTLGKEHTAWRRAKFFQQYRLFFRFHTQARVIVFAWVNDDKTKRAYGSQTDAYRVFGHMLRSGRPPSDWDALLKEAAGGRAVCRLDAAVQVTGRHRQSQKTCGMRGCLAKSGMLFRIC